MSTYVESYTVHWHEGDSDRRRLPDGTYRDDEALSAQLRAALDAVTHQARFDALFPYGRQSDAPTCGADDHPSHGFYCRECGNVQCCCTCNLCERCGGPR